MSTINDTLAALKALMATVDASPQQNANYVYAWPDDNTEATRVLHQSTPPLPVILVQRDLSQSVVVSRYHLGAMKQAIPFEINVYLKEGQLKTMEQAAAVVEFEADWVKAVSTVLSANRSVNNTALTIGNDEGLFSWQSGHIHFAESRLFWGIRFVVFVQQELT